MAASKNNDLFHCVCCGYKTLPEEGGIGSYEICPICNWEDDNLQFQKPDFAGGANTNSLREARETFEACGSSDERCKESCRKPSEEEVAAGRVLSELPPRSSQTEEL